MIVHADSPSEWMDSGPGARRRILCENKEIMMVEFRFEEGGEGAPHNHPHTQTTFVASGRFRFTVEGETKVLGPGDAMVIPSRTGEPRVGKGCSGAWWYRWVEVCTLQRIRH